MKGLKIIPLTFLIIFLTYLGITFVNLNPEAVVVRLGTENQTQPTAIGFVVVTSLFIGMCLSGAFCGIELIALTIQNRRLKRRVLQVTQTAKAAQSSSPTDQNPDVLAPKVSGRFS